MKCFVLGLTILAIVGCRQSTGPTLTYEIESEVQAGNPKIRAMVLDVVERRLSLAGRKRARVRFAAPNQIEVTLPGASPSTLTRIDELLMRPGTLEFRILANQRDHKALIERAEKEESQELRDEQGNLLAWWVPVRHGQDHAFDTYTEIAKRRHVKEKRPRLEVLVVKDPFDINGSYLIWAGPGIDQIGRPKIDFRLDSRGAKLFTRLTTKNLPDEVEGFSRKLGIILDGSLYTAPAIRDVIEGLGDITGDFTVEEAQDIIDILNVGALPVKLKRVSIEPSGKPR